MEALREKERERERERERALQLGKRARVDVTLPWCGVREGCDTASLLERGPIVRACSRMTRLLAW